MLMAEQVVREAAVAGCRPEKLEAVGQARPEGE